MAFYNEEEQLCLETDASGVGIGAIFLQVRGGIQIPRNEAQYNAIANSVCK